MLDSVGMIDNVEELNSTLANFQELTGICPCVVTVWDSDWNGEYNSLANYAYDYYVEHFSDEDHFLIVYSQPKDAANTDFVEWKWDAIQGDNTDNIISIEHFREFQYELQDLLNKEEMSVGAAINQTFVHSMNYMMKAPTAPVQKNTYDVFFSKKYITGVLVAAVVVSAIIRQAGNWIEERKNQRGSDSNQDSNHSSEDNM